MKKLLILFFFVVSYCCFNFYFPKIVKATCDPAECNTRLYPTCEDYFGYPVPGYTCFDQCCLPPGGCATVYQGCGAYGCPANTQRVCYPNKVCSEGCFCIYDPSCVVSTPPPACTTTAPTNLTLTKVGSGLWQLGWTLGANGTSQRVYLSSVSGEVDANCVAPQNTACVVSDTGVSSSATTYDVSGLSEGTVYYARVVNYVNASCYSNSSTLSDLSSCDLSSGASLVVRAGDSPTTLTSVVNGSSVIGYVSYSEPLGIVSLDPASDASYTYSTQVSGVSQGTSTITGNVYNSSSALICTGSTDVSVLPLDPWWQVWDGDIQSEGSLTTNVPSGSYFNLPGLGGFPGIVKYSLTTDLSSVDVSEKGWIAESAYSGIVMDSSRFRNMVPEDTVINTISSNEIGDSSFDSGVSSYGYEWYEYDGSLGDLSVSSPIDLSPGEKVILFVNDADFYINESINLVSGLSFFMVLVEGDIYIDPAVGGTLSDIQGIYLADSNIYTGVSDIPLHVKGSMASLGSFILQRDIDDDSGPSEIFEYDPTIPFLYPSKLSIEKSKWKEVVP